MRSEPTIIVTCDTCGCHLDGVLIPKDKLYNQEGYNELWLDKEIESWGWKIVNGKDICGECWIRREKP